MTFEDAWRQSRWYDRVVAPIVMEASRYFWTASAKQWREEKNRLRELIARADDHTLRTFVTELRAVITKEEVY